MYQKEVSSFEKRHALVDLWMCSFEMCLERGFMSMCWAVEVNKFQQSHKFSMAVSGRGCCGCAFDSWNLIAFAQKI